MACNDRWEERKWEYLRSRNWDSAVVLVSPGGFQCDAKLHQFLVNKGINITPL